MLPFCFLPSAYPGAEAALEVVSAAGQDPQIGASDWAAPLPLPQAKSSAALASGIYKAKKAGRSQCSTPENLNVSLKETLSQHVGIHQYEVTHLPLASLPTILHKNLESFAPDLLSWPSIIRWTHLGSKPLCSGWDVGLPSLCSVLPHLHGRSSVWDAGKVLQRN